MFKQNFEKCCAQIYGDAINKNVGGTDEIINDFISNNSFTDIETDVKEINVIMNEFKLYKLIIGKLLKLKLIKNYTYVRFQSRKIIYKIFGQCAS